MVVNSPAESKTTSPEGRNDETIKKAIEIVQKNQTEANKLKEAKLAVRTTVAFRNNIKLLQELGFYNFPEEVAGDDISALQKRIEVGYVERDFEGSDESKKIRANQENERLERFKRMASILANAEYLTPEIKSLEVSITPPVTKKRFENAGKEVRDDYSSPPILQLQFNYSEALYISAKQAGYDSTELDVMMKDEGKLVAPKKYREMHRCNDTRVMINLPMTDDEYQQYSSSNEDAKKFFDQTHQTFQQKIANAETTNFVFHGWTGGAEMARSLDPDKETDLAENFFANLDKEKQLSAICVAFTMLGMGEHANFVKQDEKENRGFSPFDYAIQITDTITSLGFFNQNEDGQKTDYIFTGHSMGGGAILHVLLHLGKMLDELADKPKSRVKNALFEIFNPAVVLSEGTTHEWADYRLRTHGEALPTEIVRRGTALMVTEGAETLKKIFGRLGKAYDVLENLVTGILTDFVLLPSEREALAKLLEFHKKNSIQYGIASATTALGSIGDVVITETDIEILSKLKNVFAYIWSGVQEKMVTPIILENMLTIIAPGGHYGFKDRRNQQYLDILRQTLFNLNPAERSIITKLAQKLTKQKTEHPDSPFSLEKFYSTLLDSSFRGQSLVDLDIDAKDLTKYLLWKGQFVISQSQTLSKLSPQKVVTKFQESNGNSKFQIINLDDILISKLIKLESILQFFDKTAQFLVYNNRDNQIEVEGAIAMSSPPRPAS